MRHEIAAFASGLPKDQEIADVIAYLKRFGPDGKRTP